MKVDSVHIVAEFFQNQGRICTGLSDN